MNILLGTSQPGSAVLLPDPAAQAGHQVVTVFDGTQAAARLAAEAGIWPSWEAGCPASTPAGWCSTSTSRTSP
jgi:hypothetical protein